MNWAKLKGEVPQIPLALADSSCCYIGEGQKTAWCLHQCLQPQCLVSYRKRTYYSISWLFISPSFSDEASSSPSCPLFCVGVLTVWMFVHHVGTVPWRPEESVRSPGLEIQMIVSCHLVPGNWTQVLWNTQKSSLDIFYKTPFCLGKSQFLEKEQSLEM